MHRVFHSEHQTNSKLEDVPAMIFAFFDCILCRYAYNDAPWFYLEFKICLVYNIENLRLMNTLKMYGIEESAVYHSRRKSFKKNKSDIFNLETHCVSYGFGMCTKYNVL